MSEKFDVTTLRGRRADQRWNRLVVGDLLERVTWSTPDKTAIIGREGAYSDDRFQQVSYLEGDRYANQIAHALRSEGLNEGDRVLLYCDNSVEALLTMIGVAKAGMVVVPVNPLLAPDVLEYAMTKVEPSLIIVDAGLYEQGSQAFQAYGLSPKVTIPIGSENSIPGAVPFAQWIESHPTHEVEDLTLHADDIWALVFTSGTTSMPKASMMTHTYSYMSGYAYAMSLTRGLEVETDLVSATFMPIIYHCGHNSLPLPTFQVGGTTVLGRRPNEQQTADAVTEEKVTAAWLGSPLWVEKLVQAAENHPKEIDLSSMTVAMFSWGAMRPDLAERLKEVCGAQVRMLEVFGQTESMSCYRFWPDREPEKHQESINGVNHVGRPTPILAADIHRADGTSLKGIPGEAGEAVYRSPVITAGYYRDPEATAEAFRDGWFHSGDSCMYTSDGSQIMVDRFKDIVKSGGENVSSVRVEGVVASHPEIASAAVVGVPDERWGEAVTAAVVRRPGANVSEQELIEFVRERLAGFESPKNIVFVDELPSTVGGKIMKFKLREQLSRAGVANA